jgi:hypothetical protein
VSGLNRAEWAGYSWLQVTTLVELGFEPDQVRMLLDLADDENDHPDWSEASNEEIAVHFHKLHESLLVEMAEGGES